MSPTINKCALELLGWYTWIILNAKLAEALEWRDSYWTIHTCRNLRRTEFSQKVSFRTLSWKVRGSSLINHDNGSNLSWMIGVRTWMVRGSSLTIQYRHSTLPWMVRGSNLNIQYRHSTIPWMVRGSNLIIQYRQSTLPWMIRGSILINHESRALVIQVQVSPWILQI